MPASGKVAVVEIWEVLFWMVGSFLEPRKGSSEAVGTQVIS